MTTRGRRTARCRVTARVVICASVAGAHDDKEGDDGDDNDHHDDQRDHTHQAPEDPRPWITPPDEDHGPILDRTLVAPPPHDDAYSQQWRVAETAPKKITAVIVL